MKHGRILNQTFAGTQLLSYKPDWLRSHGVGLGTAGTYRFLGYKTSIMRFLIDMDETKINCLEGETIQIKYGQVADTATEQYVGAIQSAALGVAGEFVTMIEMMNNVLDGVSVAGMVGDMAPGFDANNLRPLKRPSALAYRKDHALNKKVIIDLRGGAGVTPGWTDTGSSLMTFKTLAFLIRSF